MSTKLCSVHHCIKRVHHWLATCPVNFCSNIPPGIIAALRKDETVLCDGAEVEVVVAVVVVVAVFVVSIDVVEDSLGYDLRKYLVDDDDDVFAG